ncbi:hypothetical protein NIG5292_02922 [Nereida ignava]|uniref:Uncharacterized protein n=1 Tax=Nereida ignava TaxID=282199 RepID=A0A0U1NQ19_9RHOB|nr:hypothetical protein NIG5292_02922 [Nereida ignava]
MGLDDPFQLQPARLDLADQLIGVIKGDATGCVVDVHNAVDDRAGIRCGVFDDVADRVCCIIKEGLNVRGDVHVYRVRHCQSPWSQMQVVTAASRHPQCVGGAVGGRHSGHRFIGAQPLSSSVSSGVAGQVQQPPQR